MEGNNFFKRKTTSERLTEKKKAKAEKKAKADKIKNSKEKYEPG